MVDIGWGWGGPVTSATEAGFALAVIVRDGSEGPFWVIGQWPLAASTTTMLGIADRSKADYGAIRLRAAA